MRKDNVAAWFERAPIGLAVQTEQLLEKVERMRGCETIYPPQDCILNALATTGPDAVKAVIVGQDPYHEPGQAMGLAFSVPDAAKIPPSLRNIYKEMASDLGVPLPASGDLTPWARQGVLLLNTSLTVEAGKAASHAKLGWQVLTNYIVGECFRLPRPVVFLAWGKHAIGVIEAGRACAGVADDKCVLASTHPSPLSASRAAGEIPAFLGSRPFSRANEFLESRGTQPINWACLK